MDSQEQQKALTERTRAIPLVEGTDFLVDENAANAAFLFLREVGSQLPEHVRAIVAKTIIDAERELEESPDGKFFAITHEALLAFAINIAQLATAQTVSDIGRISLQSQELEAFWQLPAPRLEEE